MLNPFWLLSAFEADTSRRTLTEVVVSAPPLIVRRSAIGGVGGGKFSSLTIWLVPKSAT